MPNLGKKDAIRQWVQQNPRQPDERGYALRCAKATGTSLRYCQCVLSDLGITIERPRGEVPVAEPMTLSERVLADRQMAGLRGKIALLEHEKKELQKQANAQDTIIELAKLALDALPPVAVPTPLHLPSKPDVESAVLVASCWHIGEVVRSEEMNGMNEYNFDIFCKRVQRLVEKTISFTAENMKAHTFDELRIFFTGDMVSGIIHDELTETNQLNIIEQATLGALVTAQAIRDLAAKFPRIICTCVVGNHGRVRKEKYFKGKWVNWDTVFYNYLALLLRNQTNVTFQIPQSFWTGVEVKGWKFLITHGDLIKSWGSIPFYGIKRAVDAWLEIEAARGKFFQYFVASHFHNKAVLQKAVGESILNASLKGGDEYALGIGRYSDPVQLLFGVHHRYGKTWEIGINTKYLNGLKPRYHADPHLTLPEQLDAPNP